MLCTYTIKIPNDHQVLKVINCSSKSQELWSLGIIGIGLGTGVLAATRAPDIVTKPTS